MFALRSLHKFKTQSSMNWLRVVRLGFEFGCDGCGLGPRNGSPAAKVRVAAEWVIKITNLYN